MNFFNFGGPTAEIDIILTPPDRDRSQQQQLGNNSQQNDLKNGTSSNELAVGHTTAPLYYDGETVAGRVVVKMKKAPAKLEHHGIRVEFVGQIEMYYDRGNHHEFIAMEKMLARPGELLQTTTFPFEFAHVEKPYETYFGANVKLRYFVRATVARRLTDLVKEQDIMVHSIASYPDLSEPIKMEVGIEESLHIEFEYSKSKYHLKDVIIGKIYFLLVRVKIKYMELSILRKELTGYGASNYDTAESVIARYEIMDGAPVRGESIPIRLFLSGYPDLTPTMKDVQKKFSVRYFLNLVLVDEEDRRYFKQQEVIFWRKGEKLRRPMPKNLAYGVAYGQQYDQQPYPPAQEQQQQGYIQQQQNQQPQVPYRQPIQQPQHPQQPAPFAAAAGAGDGDDSYNSNFPRKQIFVGTSTSQGPAAAARQKAVAAAAAAAGHGGGFEQIPQSGATAVRADVSENDQNAVSSGTTVSKNPKKLHDEKPAYFASSDNDNTETRSSSTLDSATTVQSRQHTQKFEQFENFSTTAVAAGPSSYSPPAPTVSDADEDEGTKSVPRQRQSQIDISSNADSVASDQNVFDRPSSFYAAAANANTNKDRNHIIAADSDTLRASPPPLHTHSSFNNNDDDTDDASNDASPEKFAVPVMPPSSSGGGKQKNFYSRNFDDSSDDAGRNAGAIDNNTASSSGASAGKKSVQATQRLAAMNLFGDDADDDE